MTPPKLPHQIHVIVRDWLNSNSIVLRSAKGNAVIDSGYGAHAQRTLALLDQALRGEKLHWLLNTHCHSDHMGGNAAIQRHYGCRVSIPAGEAPLIERWDTRELWLDFADQRAEKFAFDDTISPGDQPELGELSWQAIAAPGHDMGALVFCCESEGLLISGDALWENGFGIVIPEPDNPTRIRATRATLEAISALDIATVIPGHGKPFSNISEALERAFQRLEALEADPVRMARHVLKVMLVFALLDKGRMPLADLPAYMDQIACYREFNALFLKLEPAALAELLVGELERGKVVERRAGYLWPAPHFGYQAG